MRVAEERNIYIGEISELYVCVCALSIYTSNNCDVCIVHKVLMKDCFFFVALFIRKHLLLA